MVGDEALVRDLFIFQLETGQRYEDINGLNIGIGSSDNCSIRLTQQKTTTTVTILLTEVAKGIISKYNGQLPKIPNAKANKVLKHIAYLAGIRRKCSGIEHGNGELYRYEDEAWKFIGTHTARRSFVTINSATCTPCWKTPCSS